MESTPIQKHKPTRRGHAGGRNRNASQKTYGSENDVPSATPFHPVSPYTPQKLASAGNGGANEAPQTQPQTQPTNQKQRNKGKARNKKNGHGAVSPGQHPHERTSPPFLPQDDTAPIFAGSTFHASPAPSALPIPSFLGRSSVASPLGAPQSSSPHQQQVSTPPTDSESESAADLSDACPPRNEDSPLEFFFRADRAEKERTRRASSAIVGAKLVAPFSPPQESPREASIHPRTVAHSSFRRPPFSQSNSSPGISTSELDGNPGQPVGPAFSTPYQDRIRAARSIQSSAQNPAQVAPVTSQAQSPHLNSSDALKRYLFTGRFDSSASRELPRQSQSPLARQPLQSSPQFSQQQYPSPDVHRQAAPAQVSSQPQQRFPRGMFPASVLTGYPSPAQSTVSSTEAQYKPNARPDHLVALEGDLRRMLKLDSLT
ncbi:hypothetical protein F5Y18DRAFT_229726 [Xylariaceae sp. FL1019]|nr:hypothetical protein F5Y18DRAFT_229726 [Xylariaceae sp. FL1019]